MFRSLLKKFEVYVMKISEDTKSLFFYTFGSKSHINTAGKIIFSPIIIIIIVTWAILDILFAKEESNEI